MRLSEMGLEPATLACLHRGGINTTYWLLDHTYRELIWHSEITPEALYDSRLRRKLAAEGERWVFNQRGVGYRLI
jgi:hypothetical protein